MRRYSLSVLIIFILTNIACVSDPRTKTGKTYPDLSGHTISDISQGNIHVGMTREEVSASWGDPDDIHRTVDSRGVREQWVYDRERRQSPPTYFYFENNQLKSWQDSSISTK